MNKYFEDARYYLKRAGKTAKAGVAEELEPIRERFQTLTGQDEEPEPGRLEEIRQELAELAETAEGETKEAIQNAREKIASYREKEKEA